MGTDFAIRTVRRVWAGMCLLYWCSPLPRLFPRRVSLDSLTADLTRCRQDVEAVRATSRFRPELDATLAQLEWEHVRRLERAGRSNDPFVHAVHARLQG